jgi:tRNA threonylcarbamoyl adenosine modification protein YeaZ
MLVLALDSALASCTVGLVADGALRASQHQAAGRGQASLLPVMAAALLQQAGVTAHELDLVAVTIGPGSFTGIRAGLALAHGIALGAGIPVVGVTVGEALADSLPHLGGRRLWTAIGSRRGRIFLERDGIVEARPLDDLPAPDGPVAVAGDAAVALAARLAARDGDVMLTDARRLAGALPARAAQPLYVDPPEARLPAGGLRPAPLA